MRLRQLATTALGCLELGAVVLCHAAAFSDVVAQVKPSIVAIGTYERTRSPAFAFRGTGFVVRDGTLVATNAHVVPAVLDPARLETLVVMIPVPGRPGDAERREARVLKIDRDHDLAVLRVSGPPLPALKIAPATAVLDGNASAFTGFPIGAALGLVPVTHRATVSAVTPIALPGPNAGHLDAAIVRRLGGSSFNVLQLDATAYPGNSGSPLYDVETGEVIGIINMVMIKNTRETLLSQPSGISFALPSEYLTSLLDAAAKN